MSTNWPEGASQSRITVSFPAEASRLPSGLERHRPDVPAVSSGIPDFLVRGEIPELDAEVAAGGRQASSVGAVGEAESPLGMIGQGIQVSARDCVPEFDGPVLVGVATGGGERLTVRAERDSPRPPRRVSRRCG